MQHTHERQRHPGRSTLVEPAVEPPASQPGKRTLTEALAAGEPTAAPHPREPRRPVAPPRAASAGGATLQMLFGRRGSDDAALHAAAAQGAATPVSGLPHREAIQRAFGRHDVSAIQSHVGPEATASTQAMGAEAYATGAHVVFGRAPDLHTAAHEAAHVIQQRAGVHLKGGVGQAGDGYERHADAVADLVVAGRSAEAMLDAGAGGGGAAGSAVQAKFAKGDVETAFIDLDTDEAYELVRSTEGVWIVQRTADHIEVRIDRATMEPIENEHQRAFRLREAGPLVTTGYRPPSVAKLYQQMFPGGTTFTKLTFQEVIDKHAGDIAEVHQLALEVEALKRAAATGSMQARTELQVSGPALQQKGDALTKILFGHVESYNDFLFLMDRFLAGELPANPVYNGTLWGETGELIGRLREMTRYGITTWESQPSNQERAIESTDGVTERQYAFLELSGPPEIISALARQLASFTTITVIAQGDTRRVPLKQLRAKSLPALEDCIGEQANFQEPVKAGGYHRANWLDTIANNSKYVGKAVTKVPSLETVIGGHRYLYLVSKSVDEETALFDIVAAVLPQLQPIKPVVEHPHDDDREHEDDHDAELEHQNSYSTTAEPGNLGE